MPNYPAVSVLMPVFNAGAYLSEAITSVLDQTYRDFELIIINDGSTDTTLNILSAFSTDKRIRVINNDINLGLVATLNKGLSECKGIFIARMDADDICDLRRIERQVRFLNENLEISIVGGAIRFFHNIVQPYTFHFPTTHDAIHASILFFCPLAHPAIMFRRTLIDNGLIRFDNNYRHAEDYHLWSRLLPQIKTANLPELVLHYRLHNSQVSSNQSNKQYNVSLQVRKEILDLAKICWTDQELVLHESVLLEKPILESAYLQDLANWFKKIEESNFQSGYWNVYALNVVLKQQFNKTALNFPLNVPLSIQENSNVKRYLDSTTISQINTLCIRLRRFFKKIKYFMGRK